VTQATITIKLLGYWHAGSGLGQGGRAHAIVLRDAEELPYLPGRTVKGLLREGVLVCEELGRADEGVTQRLFGQHNPNEDDRDSVQAGGQLFFSNAVLDENMRKWLSEGGAELRQQLFDVLASTALADGVADTDTLRVTEVTLPMTLTATVSGPDDLDWQNALRKGASLVRALGSHRHRGLGRCEIMVGEAAVMPGVGEVKIEASKTRCQWLEIELKSDVIVSATAATIGGHESLDYLPGSVLLGAAAGAWRNRKGSFDPEAFLSGKIRFGDGLPIGPDAEMGWPMPQSYHQLKQTAQGESEKIELINALTLETKEARSYSESGNQLQAFRKGRVTSAGHLFDLPSAYQMKTAVSREDLGSAAEGQLFGYDALCAGSRFRARLSWDEDQEDAAGEILALLLSDEVRLGRSRSAQYGEVRISKATAPAGLKTLDAFSVPDDPSKAKLISIYALSDLALFSEGTPTFHPLPKDFGLTGCEFVPERSFVRVRRYSPWNAYRNSRDTERQVIRRGSVLTFRMPPGSDAAALINSATKATQSGVGGWRAEGLGQVAVNPDLILAPSSKLDKPPKPRTNKTTAAMPAPEVAIAEVPLVQVLQLRHIQAQVANRAVQEGRRLANTWIKFHHSFAQGASGKSQWSHVRELASRYAGQGQKLRDEIRKFCEEDLRRRYWCHPIVVGRQNTTLAAELQNALRTSVGSSEQLLTSTVVYAAIEMTRRLQGQRQETIRQK
jgi:CRISPR/Cas system CSM-associated protein Csm3 (group 7 of RAMP superfamily)